MLAWEAEWRRQKPLLEKAGITACEVRFAGCWGRYGLTPAHSKKRANIVGDELGEFCICCIPCHESLELMKEKDMTDLVRAILARRPIIEKSKIV